MLLTPPRTVHVRMRMIWIRAAAISWSPLLRWRTVSIASKKCVLASTAHTLIWPFPALTSHGFTERGFFDFSHVLEGPLRQGASSSFDTTPSRPMRQVHDALTGDAISNLAILFLFWQTIWHAAECPEDGDARV